jgi:hypothetical protein
MSRIDYRELMDLLFALHAAGGILAGLSGGIGMLIAASAIQRLGGSAMMPASPSRPRAYSFSPSASSTARGTTG